LGRSFQSTSIPNRENSEVNCSFLASAVDLSSMPFLFQMVIWYIRSPCQGIRLPLGFNSNAGEEAGK
jgi:hypothetical protein